MSSNTQALVQYYVREGYYNKVQMCCDQELRSNNDPVLIFWKAYAKFCEGNSRDAMLETESILDKRGMSMPTANALIYYHQQCSVVDQDAVSDLQMRLRRESGDENARVLSAQFFTTVGDYEKARELLLPLEGSSTLAVQSTRGWLEFYAGRESAAAAPGKTNTSYLDSCANIFEQAIGSGGDLGNLEALMARQRCLRAKGNGSRHWIA
jgi:hypothetical protein